MGLDQPTITAIIVLVTTFITGALGRVLDKLLDKLLGLNSEKTTRSAAESDIAKDLSEAAQTQIETYVNFIVKPLEEKLERTEKELTKTQEKLKSESDLRAELEVKVSDEKKIRQSVEGNLKITTERMGQLEADYLSLSLRFGTLESEQEAWKVERRTWRDGILKVINQFGELNPGVQIAWTPPETGPLGKLKK